MVTQAPHRDLINVTKTCESCGRPLPGLAFLFSQHVSGLTTKCRTCRSSHKASITADEAEHHEQEMEDVYVGALRDLAVRYPDEFWAVGAEDLIDAHRAEFEQALHRGMWKAHLLEDWDLPVWVNPVSLTDFEVS